MLKACSDGKSLAKPSPIRRWPLKGAYFQRAGAVLSTSATCHNRALRTHDATASGGLCNHGRTSEISNRYRHPDSTDSFLTIMRGRTLVAERVTS